MPHPPLSIDDLHAMDRVGALALSPDGTQVVCSVTRSDMAANRLHSALWLMPVQGGRQPRRLTTCGERDGAPAWSPRGDRVAFLARRTQDGEADKTPQLYLIAPDGGEARRASRFAPGITSFRWMPDGRRVLFAAWTWPELSAPRDRARPARPPVGAPGNLGRPGVSLKGAAAQARRHQAFVDRKETGYATSEALYRHWDQHLPQGRVLHLWLLDVDSGRAVDLFEGTA
ncbi:MAG: PD40 domain-containing protein, partial [Rhodoferax sp.]|nr:PD40 domain-containing protein [Rhodoferax sp.]